MTGKTSRIYLERGHTRRVYPYRRQAIVEVAAHRASPRVASTASRPTIMHFSPLIASTRDAYRISQVQRAPRTQTFPPARCPSSSQSRAFLYLSTLGRERVYPNGVYCTWFASQKRKGIERSIVLLLNNANFLR